MKRITKKIFLYSLCICAAFQFFTCKENSPTGPTSKTRAALWEEDINYFSSQLKANEYGLSSLISIQSFDNNLNNLKSSIDSLKDYEIYFKLQQLIASFKVAHITSVPSSKIKLHLLPFNTFVFSDGVYVISADQNNSALLGKKIIGVGGTAIQTVEDSLKKIISHENDYWFEDQLPTALSCIEVLKYYGFATSDSSAEIDIEGGGKTTITASANSVGMINILNGKTLPLYLQNQSSNYWYSFIAANNALYIKYNKCANSTDVSFSNFTNNVKDFISSNQVNKIIVDLRNNGGGNSSIINPLVNYIISSPYNQTGKLFVITNRGTFSSALMNAISFKQSTNSILVGEATGGKPNSYGEVSTFNLPNSGIAVNYCTKYFQAMSGDPESLFPDYNIEMTFEDFINCKDAMLEYILNYK